MILSDSQEYTINQLKSKGCVVTPIKKDENGAITFVIRNNDPLKTIRWLILGRRSHIIGSDRLTEEQALEMESTAAQEAV